MYTTDNEMAIVDKALAISDMFIKLFRVRIPFLKIFKTTYAFAYYDFCAQIAY